MYAIIGLGNPGPEYKGTRHNIGFEVVDAIAAQFGVSLKSKWDECLIGRVTINEEQHLLVKPMTYMNNSGVAVRKVVNFYNTPYNHLLVIVDDFQIPLGSLRMRLKGSDGGHQGLLSLIHELGTNEFPRVRCGIRGETMPSNKQELTQYVLEVFKTNEEQIVKKMIEDARNAVIMAIKEGIETAMNKFNKRHDTKGII